MLGIEAMFFRLFMENHPICAAATVTNSVVIPTDVTYVEPNRTGSTGTHPTKGCPDTEGARSFLDRWRLRSICQGRPQGIL